MIFNYIKERYGYSKKDISLMVGTYQVLGIATFGALWITCYRLNPSLMATNSSFLLAKLNKFTINYPNISSTIHTKIESIKNWSETNKYIKSASAHMGVKPKRVTSSLVEAFVIEKIGFPIIFPLQLGTSIWIVNQFSNQTTILLSDDDYGLYNDIDY